MDRYNVCSQCGKNDGFGGCGKFDDYDRFSDCGQCGKITVLMVRSMW